MTQRTILAVALTLLFLIFALPIFGPLVGPYFRAALPPKFKPYGSATRFEDVTPQVANNAQYVSWVLQEPTFMAELQVAVWKDLPADFRAERIHVHAHASGRDGIGHLAIRTARIRALEYSINANKYLPVKDPEFEETAATMTRQLQDAASRYLARKLRSLSGDLTELDGVRVEIGNLAEEFQLLVRAEPSTTQIQSKRLYSAEHTLKRLETIRDALTSLLEAARAGVLADRVVHRIKFGEATSAGGIDRITWIVNVHDLDLLAAQAQMLPTTKEFEIVTAAKQEFTTQLARKHGVRCVFSPGSAAGGVLEPSWLESLTVALESSEFMERAIIDLHLGATSNSVLGDSKKRQGDREFRGHLLVLKFPSTADEMLQFLVEKHSASRNQRRTFGPSEKYESCARRARQSWESQSGLGSLQMWAGSWKT